MRSGHSLAVPLRYRKTAILASLVIFSGPFNDDGAAEAIWELLSASRRSAALTPVARDTPP